MQKDELGYPWGNGDGLWKPLADSGFWQEALAKKQQTRLAGKSKDQFVFILADQKDSTMAEDIFKFLDQQGFPCGVPITIETGNFELPPDEIRRDFEDNIQKAAGTIIVYGNSPPTWYRSQLSRVRQVRGVLV